MNTQISSASFASAVFAGESPAARRLRLQVTRIAPHFRTALLVGEEGSGKIDVARELHRLSPVANGSFRRWTLTDAIGEQGPAWQSAIDSIPFGTLYLEGLSTISLPAQRHLQALVGRLDRLIRTRYAETRLLCATTSDLRGMVATGRMDAQLYTRLGGLELQIPPLRERLEDLESLMPLFAPGIDLSPEAVTRLRHYHWPGNLTELARVLQHARNRSGVSMLRESDLPPLTAARQEVLEDARLDLVLHRHVTGVLERCAGNKLKAAEALGISRSTLYRMLDSAAA